MVPRRYQYTDLFFSTTTDANGYFTLSLDRVGEYEIYIGRATEDGYFDKEYTIAIDSDASTYDVGEIELEFYYIESDDQNYRLAGFLPRFFLG